MTEDNCQCFTRFTKSELHQLHLYLRIPETFRLATRHTFTGEEALLIFLTRVGGSFGTWRTMEFLFGGHATSWGLLFAAMIDHLYSTFYHKITGDSLRQWCTQENVNYFCSLIWNKTKYSPYQFERFLSGESEHVDIVDVPYETFKTFGFIDDTNFRTYRPGTGPNGDYDYASCKDNAHNIHAAFYSGYMKYHGVKYQTVLLPNGMWGSVYGASMRHNDKGVLNMSGLVDYLISLLQPIEGAGLPGLYGDRIFDTYPVIFRAVQNPTDPEHKLDTRMNSLRTSIELAYGVLFNTSRLLRDKSKAKLLKDKKQAMRFGIVCFFLSNCKTCLRGSQVNSMFDSHHPTLDQYIPLNEEIPPFDMNIENNDMEY